MDLQTTKRRLDCVKVFNVSIPNEAVTWIYSEMDTLIIRVIIPSVSAVGLLANTAFLFMIARLPKMRTVVSSYIANLALCDMLFLAFANIWYAITFEKSDVAIDWPVKSVLGCAGLTLTTHTWYYASVGIMSLISLERYLAVCHPIRHMSFKGGKRNAKLLAFIWISALLITLSIIPRYSWYHYVCMLWPDLPEYQTRPSRIGICGTWGHSFNTYEGLLLITIFMTSAFGNGVLYFKILQALSSRSILKCRAGDNIQVNRVRDQVARTLIINGVVFFICQIPSRIDNLDDAFDYLAVDFEVMNDQQEATVTLVGHAFLFLNSVINPFIYVATCRHYRQGMIEAFTLQTNGRRHAKSSLRSITTNL